LVSIPLPNTAPWNPPFSILQAQSTSSRHQITHRSLRKRSLTSLQIMLISESYRSLIRSMLHISAVLKLDSKTLSSGRRTESDFPPRRPGFKPGSGHVGFCDGQKWRRGRFSPRT
jgi:hypothetical protein